MSAMERTTDCRSNALTFDGPKRNPQDARDTSGPSTDSPVDDPAPLFLSDLQDRPETRGFQSFVANHRTGILARVAAGGLVVLAFAILVLVAVFNSEYTRVSTTKAEASIGAPGDQLPTPVASNRLAEPQIPSDDDKARATDPVAQASVDTGGPRLESSSRGDVVSHDRAASQSEVPTIRPGNEGAMPSKTLDAETLATLMTRARSLLTFGDVIAARLLLERAASARDASAAFLLARTYDPAVLGVGDPRSIAPDPVMAREWYRKAASFGSAEAQQRLAQLQN